jgi:SAM-dependent methyltransferase
VTRLSDFVNDRTMSELYDAYWVPTVLDVYARGLASNVERGNRVLDLSCGTGLVTGYAAERAGPSGDIVGYDPTPELLDATRAKAFSGAPIRWIEGFGEDSLAKHIGPEQKPIHAWSFGGPPALQRLAECAGLRE